MKNTQRLKTALKSQLQQQEADQLATLLEAGLSTETIPYEDIDLPEDQKNDCILTAFEERMLIPVKSGQSPAWEDRILALCPGEIYFIPPVVRKLIERAGQTGKLDPERAVKEALPAEAGNHVNELVQLFQHVKRHAPSYTVEVGLMGTIMRQLEIALDLHDVIDLFVICGIISSCTRGPMSTGLVWYEINPCLYWNLKTNPAE